MQQQLFYERDEQGCLENSGYLVDSFSASGFSKEAARAKLERKYANRLKVTDSFNRRSVSFQSNKNERLHSWLKYREGFSAELVDGLLGRLDLKSGKMVMDPFIGSGTTGIVCKIKGIDTIGFDILPISRIAIRAKEEVYTYDIRELEDIVTRVKKLRPPSGYSGRVNTVPITKYAYPVKNDMFLAYYSDWVRSSQYEPLYKNFLLLAALNSLEAVSYTAKDGQYLRWDHRSQKVIETNNRREKAGRPPLKTKFDKGPIPFAKDIIVEELQAMVSDVRHIQDQGTSENGASICVFQRSVLEALPAMEGNSIDGVITSPPYCNRYDYTRTYALELAFLGLDNEDIKTLRQELLTCTVENRSKIAQIEKVYNENGRSDDFFHVMQILNKNEAIREVLAALHKRQQAGELNNDGIIRMVEGYFTELAFVYAELFRVVKPDAYVAFVNDNVRYAGEIIPVDFISCELATAFGFKVEGILCIEQQKGNSSQQMKRYGRVPLRKSITIWKK